VFPQDKGDSKNVSWQEFEAILEELGERAARPGYDDGTLEIMTPLPEHEDNKEIIGIWKHS